MKFKSNVSIIFFAVTFFILNIFLNSEVHAQANSLNLGIIGDSSSDEYRGTQNVAGGSQWASTTLNWVELMHNYRGINLGTWGNYSEPRRTGYEFNWARYAGTTVTMINQGQHTGLATQIATGRINQVYMCIGTNDFAYYGDGASIYNGTLSGQALTDKINNFIVNITTALDTVQAADPNIPIILATAGDMSNLPYWRAAFPDPVKRQKVTNAVNQANQGIRAAASTRSHITLVEGLDLLSYIFSRVDAQGNINIGGESISFVSNGDEPHHGVLADNTHLGTALSALQANKVMDLIASSSGIQVSHFSDTEILSYSGISHVTMTPQPTPTDCHKADIDQNKRVELADYSLLVQNFLKTPFPNPRADIDGNGRVDLRDYSILVANFFHDCL